MGHLSNHQWKKWESIKSLKMLKLWSCFARFQLSNKISAELLPNKLSENAFLKKAASRIYGSKKSEFLLFLESNICSSNICSFSALWALQLLGFALLISLAQSYLERTSFSTNCDLQFHKKICSFYLDAYLLFICIINLTFTCRVIF